MASEHLWSGWRSQYITGLSKSTDCIFCVREIPASEDEARLIVHRGVYSFVLMNLYPYNPGHLMIAPYRHCSDFSELTDEELAEIATSTRKAIVSLKNTARPEGFNVGYNLGKCAGAGFDAHLHQHIVPRWGGDTNFMPVLGETRVIPCYIEETYRQLKTSFATL